MPNNFNSKRRGTGCKQESSGSISGRSTIITTFNFTNSVHYFETHARSVCFVRQFLLIFTLASFKFRQLGGGGVVKCWL
jgi:hypothetical protein